MKKLVVIGAGVSGLAAAFRLQQLAPTVDITVLEREGRVGGNAWTARRDGFQVEIGPNGFLDSKPSTLKLCHDLGLGDRLIAASEASGKNRYLFLDGKLRALPGGFGSFLASDLLSWRGKLAFLAERFRRNRPINDDESVDAFARRRAGPEIAAIFADAMVTGIHAGDPALLSVRAAFPRVAALEREYGSVIKGMAASAKQRRREATERGETYRRGSRMWSFREGLRLLMETMRDRLTKPPLTGTSVSRVERTDGGWIVRGEGGQQWPADAVFLACPASEQARLVADLDASLAEKMNEIAYNRVAVVALGYRQVDVPTSLDGFGYISPQRTRRDLLGVQWCSSIFPERAPSGDVLMRALCGGWNRPDVLDWNDTRLVNAVREELRLALGITAAPRFHEVIRWERAIPQYHVGHLGRVAAIEEKVGRHSGLFVGGNAYHGVALNDCTEQAEILAERIRRHLAPT